MATLKKRILTSYERLTDELLEEFKLAFPSGYEQFATEEKKSNGQKFYAVRMETDDAIYLIEVEMRTDKWEDDEEEDGDDIEVDISGGKADMEPGDIDEEEEPAESDDDDADEADDDYDM